MHTCFTHSLHCFRTLFTCLSLSQPHDLLGHICTPCVWFGAWYKGAAQGISIHECQKLKGGREETALNWRERGWQAGRPGNGVEPERPQRTEIMSSARRAVPGVQAVPGGEGRKEIAEKQWG